MTLFSGGQSAPGKGVRLAITGVSRHKIGDSAFGTYYLLSATR